MKKAAHPSHLLWLGLGALFLLLAGPLSVLGAIPVPYLVKDINPAGSSSPILLTGANGTLFFVADDGGTGQELWKSDGTDPGTQLVKDIASTPPDPFVPSSLAELGGSLFFSGNDGSPAGEELWSSNGTPAGTNIFMDINPSGDSSPARLRNVNGTLFFVADDGVHGQELWKSNGTTPGTAMVKDINPMGATSSPSILTAVGNLLYFRATDGSHGFELWMSDGTITGTVQVQDINPGPGSSSPADLVSVGTTLFFTADDGSHGAELWKSDGTSPGTVMVKDIFTGPTGSTPDKLVVVNTSVFFQARDSSFGSELWKSDGDESTTVLVKDINPSGNSSPSSLFNASGTLYFTAFDMVNGRELWKSDGTGTGTLLVKDINPGIGSSTAVQMIAVNTTLFFGADDGVHGVELWKSNGTADGTSMIGDIHPTLGSNPTSFTLLNKRLFFAADDGSHQVELWALEINLANQAPTADAGGPYNASEGSPLTLLASATDDDTGLTYTWEASSPLCTFVDPFVLQSQVTCADNGVYMATLTVTDWWGVTAASPASITVANVQPVVQAPVLVPDPGRVGSQVNLQASFDDAGSADTHTAQIDWGDGTVEPATVDQGANTLTGSHVYDAAGDYALVVTVTDDDGGTGNQGETFTVAFNTLFLPILIK